nr:uncharacterized protein LOC108390710 [Manis javanica]
MDLHHALEARLVPPLPHSQIKNGSLSRVRDLRMASSVGRLGASPGIGTVRPRASVSRTCEVHTLPDAGVRLPELAPRPPAPLSRIGSGKTPRTPPPHSLQPPPSSLRSSGAPGATDSPLSATLPCWSAQFLCLRPRATPTNQRQATGDRSQLEDIKLLGKAGRTFLACPGNPPEGLGKQAAEVGPSSVCLLGLAGAAACGALIGRREMDRFHEFV